MPTTEEHRKLALRHESTVQKIPNIDRLAPEWGITVRFYAALHWVRAHLRQKGKGEEDLDSHRKVRNILLKENWFPPHVVSAYLDFYPLSLEARYDTLGLNRHKAQKGLAKAKSLFGLIREAAKQGLPLDQS